MRDTLQALLGLQEIDRDIFRVERELERLPAEREARRGEIDRRLVRLRELAEESGKLRFRVHEIEDQTKTQRQRIRKIEQEAANARADMALQVAYQHEVRTLKREISLSEEEGLQLVERAETLESEMQGLQGEIDEEERVFAELETNIERETAQARARLEELSAARRGRMTRDLPHEALELYVRLLAAREGEAMAELEGRMCQSCFMEVPTNLVVRLRRGSELIQCPSCDRILHVRV